MIGGGVAGCSIAYHLARLGWRDVVVVEQHDLTEGTTWHSAGFVGQLRSTIGETRMIMYSTGLYAQLERETGLDPGWRGVGGLRVATTEERAQELRRQQGSATTFGLELELLGPAETRERMPLLEVGDVALAAWLPGDGYLEPALLTGALAAGARGLGVEILTHTRVTGIELRRGGVAAVATDAGTIECEHAVIAAGAASGAVGLLAGVTVPIVPIKHQYVVTEPLEEPLGDAPTVRDPDNIVYFRPERGGMLVGGYAREPVAWESERPLAEAHTLFEPDLERFAEAWEGARRRLPALREAEIAEVVHGPEAFTPDGDFVLGETEARGLWVAAGFCVHGLAAAGGVGKAIAEWIVDGRPEHDIASMDVRRFGAHHRSARLRVARALESYSKYYDVVYPGEERQAGRPLRVSAAYQRLRELGASFGDKAGWERANWLESNAASGDPELRPRGWAGRHWSPAIEAECLATRDAAALFDQSSFAKIDVHGPGALGALNRLCGNEIDRPVGSATYTQLLNPRGGIEADLTVTRVGEQRFRIVTGTASGGRDLAWIRRRLPDDGSAHAEDVTAARACLCLWGPRSRDILAGLTDADLSDEAFPFLRARELAVGAVPVLAQRITFVGELGWELYCPTEYGLSLWDSLWRAGSPHGTVAAGYRAIDSLRLEKGYRVWGSDVTPETTPSSAGLGFAVQMDKAGGFIGRDALAAELEAGGPRERLRCLVLDDERSVCLGSEPVRVEGEVRGRVTSGGFGYRVGRSIAYAYLPAATAIGTRVEVGMFGEWEAATVTREPLYDPRGVRIRGVRPVAA